MKNLCLAISMAVAVIIFSSCTARMVIPERPSPPVYVRPVAPGPRYVWVDGDWYVRGGRYVWREGYWAPTREKHWVGGHWVARRSGWYWQHGHWR